MPADRMQYRHGRYGVIAGLENCLNHEMISLYADDYLNFQYASSAENFALSRGEPHNIAATGANIMEPADPTDKKAANCHSLPPPCSGICSLHHYELGEKKDSARKLSFEKCRDQHVYKIISTITGVDAFRIAAFLEVEVSVRQRAVLGEIAAVNAVPAQNRAEGGDLGPAALARRPALLVLKQAHVHLIVFVLKCQIFMKKPIHAEQEYMFRALAVPMVFPFIHLSLLIFGFSTGVILLVAIVNATPPAVKNYSVLLLWGAFNDLVSISADLMMLERITILLPTFVYFPSGPCIVISLELCNFCNTLFCNIIAQSVIIQCVSFWYRLRILSKYPPGTIALHLLVLLCISPNIAHLVFFNNVKRESFGSPVLLKAVETLYPQHNWTGVYMYGLTNFFEPKQMLSYFYFFTMLPALFLFLVVTRYRVVRKLNETKSMSERTYRTHRIFLKILTIHAILPLSIIVGIAALILIILGFVHPALEELIYIVGSFPPMAMPVITIYFMKPYREMIFLFIHLSLLIFGLSTGVILLVAIVKATPPAVKNYSALLLWGAFNDIVSISADLMTLERLTILLPTFVYLPAGPCTAISLELCNFCNTLFCNIIAQSVIIQCVSFWYRLRILSKYPPGTIALNLLVLLCVSPNIAHLIFYNNVKRESIGSPVLLKAVEALYPQHNWTGVYMYGLTNFFEPSQLLSYLYFFTMLPALFLFLVVTRYRVVRKLKERKSMSEKSYNSHRIFLKIWMKYSYFSAQILTIHAVLPLSIIFGIFSLILIIFEFVHPALEELIYIVGSFPPMAMPVITIYFMNPYREMRLLIVLALLVVCIAALRPVPGLGDHWRQKLGQARSHRSKREADINSAEVTPESHPQFFYGKIPRLSYLYRKEPFDVFDWYNQLKMWTKNLKMKKTSSTPSLSTRFYQSEICSAAQRSDDDFRCTWASLNSSICCKSCGHCVVHQTISITMIVTFFHIRMLAIGFVTNAILLVAIAKGTPRTIKNYSVLLFWCALNDLTSIITGIMNFERITVVLPTLVLSASGPCTCISHDLFNYCNSLFCATIVQSTIIMCISFWYSSLSVQSPGKRAINVIVVLTALPNIAHMIFFKYIKLDDPELFKVVQADHPSENLTGVFMYGNSNIFEPYPALSIGYLFIKVYALQNKNFVSDKTLALHHVFLKILTIHALLPIANLAGCAAVFIIVFGIYNPELEALPFVVAIIPPVINPAVTILVRKALQSNRAMIVLSIHLVLLGLGFVMSILLLLAIFLGTPQTIKNYSVLLFWCAFNDLVSISADIMSMERLTVLLPSFVFIAVGPCTWISLDFCNYCNSFFCGTIVQSTIIQCISFWYRLRILSKPPPTAITLNVIAFACALPNIAHMIFFKHVKAYDPALLETVQTLYPHMNWTGAFLYGLSNIFEPAQAIAYGYFFVVMPALLGFLIFFRSRVSNTLYKQRHGRVMSDKTYAMHHVFLKILTIHALLPISICIGCGSVIFILLGFYNPEFEAFIFVMAMIPPIINPAITIWFMKPYRLYVTQIVFCNRLKRIIPAGSSIIGTHLFHPHLLLLMVFPPTIFWEATGPCILVGVDLCNYCNSIFCVTIIESTIIQSISFWYRNHIMTNATPSALGCHIIVMICSIPNVINCVAFKLARTQNEQIRFAAFNLYPEETWDNSIIYGLPDILRPFAFVTYGYFFFMMATLFTYMVFKRQSTLQVLQKFEHSISARTMGMHRVLIKILTLHALIPLTTISGCIGVVVMFFGYHHPEMEAMIYISAALPPALNPAVALWCLQPYREFVLRLLRRRSRVTQVKPMSLSMASSNLLIKLHKLHGYLHALRSLCSVRSRVLLLLSSSDFHSEKYPENNQTIIMDTMTIERLMVYAPTVFWEAIGPCIFVGVDFCNYCNSVFCVTIIESTIIQCISFWYRNRILNKPCPGGFRIHAIVAICTLPNVINAIAFKHVRNDGEIVKNAARILYPEETWEGVTVYGLLDIGRLEDALTLGYFFAMMPILFTYMIYERRNVLKALTKSSDSLSEKTIRIHKLMIKMSILTLHAVIPLIVIFGCIGVVLMAFGYHHPEMEAAIYLSASLPPILNPVCGLSVVHEAVQRIRSPSLPSWPRFALFQRHCSVFRSTFNIESVQKNMN
ncbi:hypothetical protein PRIPAC_76458 [Pristionchus pacificus]|uniref:G protein-coupled receptor n=1 Tax=Pristionchus pacificus TaxID=54126 RepID=A0A2A6C6W3_PRIPA|nr:hypothetical protein PRIPAC_76458 [Pristionchus pacificus]|eukprot:PDM73925.1 G protein-coupled receptor [Pristionchus pacificus]